MKSKSEKTQTSTVYCEGATPPYDHPKIYLKIDTQTNEAICPYCNKKFILGNGR